MNLQPHSATQNDYQMFSGANVFTVNNRAQPAQPFYAYRGENAQQPLARLYDVFEKEAKRIAHRLHDDSAQMLAVVYLELAEIAKQAHPETSERINDVFKLLDEVCNQLRNISHELRPIILDQLGLMPALRMLIAGVSNRESLIVGLHGDINGRVSPDVETVIYRAVQEALSNICRHAQASHADINICLDEKYLYCSISDNGRGMPEPEDRIPQVGGLGLIGMHERARSVGGVCNISSIVGRGTTVTIQVRI